jgi:hypothetical protein
VPSIIFTLIFGVLTGLAGIGGAGPFETVLMLGVIGLAHMTLVAERHAREAALSPVRGGD